MLWKLVEYVKGTDKSKLDVLNCARFVLLQVTLSFYGFIFHSFMLLWLIQHVEYYILIPKIFQHLKSFYFKNVLFHVLY